MIAFPLPEKSFMITLKWCSLAGCRRVVIGNNSKIDITQFFNKVVSLVSHFRLRNDLYCVGWGVKLYTHSFVSHWKNKSASDCMMALNMSLFGIEVFEAGCPLKPVSSIDSKGINDWPTTTSFHALSVTSHVCHSSQSTNSRTPQ